MFSRPARTLAILLVTGYWLLATFTVPVFAADDLQGNPFCFTDKECAPTVAPYFGTSSSPNVAPDCKETPDCKNALKRCYYCYAAQPKVCPPGTPASQCQYKCPEGMGGSCPMSVQLQIAIGGGTVPLKGLEGYLAAIYQWLIAVSGIFAGVMISYAGVKWMLASGNPEKISEAKKKIGDAIIGLVLIVSAYIIMQTINPALVTLHLPPIKITRRAGEYQGLCLKSVKDAKCGDTIKCKEYPDACGGISVGTCIGTYCSNVADKCAEINMQKKNILVDRVPAEIITREDMGVKAAQIIDEGKKRVCLSDQCPISAMAGGVCFASKESADEQIEQGQWSAEAQKEQLWKCMLNDCLCSIGKYTFLQDGFRQTRFYCLAGQPEDASCQIDSECASGICNQYDNECTRVSKEPGKHSCKRNAECASGLCDFEKNPDQCVPADCGQFPQFNKEAGECTDGGGWQERREPCVPYANELQTQGGNFTKSVDEQCGPIGSNWRCIYTKGFFCYNTFIVGGMRRGACSDGSRGSLCYPDSSHCQNRLVCNSNTLSCDTCDQL